MTEGEATSMAKAINWPRQYRDEVMEEPSDKRFAAFRLGRLYFDNHYWVAGEEVDIRVNHRIIRRATIIGDMKCCSIEDLMPEDYEAQKSDLKTPEAVISFLSSTYEKPVTPQTEVTVVYYQNHPLDPEIMDTQDDPHMA